MDHDIDLLFEERRQALREGFTAAALFSLASATSAVQGNWVLAALTAAATTLSAAHAVLAYTTTETSPHIAPGRQG